MTKEEAIKELSYIIDDMPSMECADWIEAISMGIKELEHELCGDAISRQAVLDMLEDINAETEGVGFYYEHYVEYIKNLPPVTPTEKVGYWIEHKTDDGRSWLECPICHIKKQYPITNYCPKCGSRNTEKDIHGEDEWV